MREITMEHQKSKQLKNCFRDLKKNLAANSTIKNKYCETGWKTSIVSELKNHKNTPCKLI